MRLAFAMSAFRATRHDATGYSPNFLVFGREARQPPDIVFEEPDEDYDTFVEHVRDRSTSAFAEVRHSLQTVSYTHLTLPTKRIV